MTLGKKKPSQRRTHIARPPPAFAVAVAANFLLKCTGRSATGMRTGASTTGAEMSNGGFHAPLAPANSPAKRTAPTKKIVEPVKNAGNRRRCGALIRRTQGFEGRAAECNEV